MEDIDVKVKITADSTCDLPREFIERYGIGVLPMYIIRDGVALRDGIDINADDMYEYTKRTGQLCSTAAVTVSDYASAWTEWLRDADAIVHIGFSSELSVSCNNARLAAEDFENVTVVDSLNLSTGFGHLVLDAAIMAGEGAEPAEIAAAIERLVPKADVSFVLNTLDYLRKGGRCTTIQALGANLLGLKPCIEVHEGKMGVAKKYRGKIEAAYHQYIRDRLQGRDDIDLRRVFITDSGLPDDVRARLRETVLECQPFKEVYNNRAGCTISGHCGPWCMGVLYYHK